MSGIGLQQNVRSRAASCVMPMSLSVFTARAEVLNESTWTASRNFSDPHVFKMPNEMRTYLRWFQKTLTFVSSSAGLKPVLMAVKTLGTTGTVSQTHLILAQLDTKVSVF